MEKHFNEINRKIDLDNFSYSVDSITKHFSSWMDYWESITFEIPQIPRDLDFNSTREGNGQSYWL